MDTLSICIPTNRKKKNLEKCLNSIRNVYKPKNFKFDVCISDNSLDLSKKKMVQKFKKNFEINYKYSKKKTNRILNMIEAINLSKSDFVWLIGDDDILLKKSLINMYKIFKLKDKNVDFIFVNSSFIKYNKFYLSKKKINKFYQLIDPKISFDFMGAMFLSVFKRIKWEKNKYILNNLKKDTTEFSTLENTFPHLIVFVKAFMLSKIFVSNQIFTKNMVKNREWSQLWPLVQSIRIPELLKKYKVHGLSFFKYCIYKNYSLRLFLPNFLKILIYKKNYPISYSSLFKHFFINLIYPNFYLSPFNYIFNKFKKISDD